MLEQNLEDKIRTKDTYQRIEQLTEQKFKLYKSKEMK